MTDLTTLKLFYITASTYNILKMQKVGENNDA
jgi:hypothetical protein